MMKRTFDIVLAGIGLTLLAPFLIPVALLIKLTSSGPVFFKQERVGRAFKPFNILKFRTMVQDAPKLGGQLTCGEDPRITRIGRILRKTKIDELPQLINVLKGEMSLVGPRPEVPRYVEMFREDYEIILQIRPGITDLASIKYRDEAALLAKADDPEKEYIEHVLPEKIQFAQEHVRRASLPFDLYIITLTIGTIIGDRLAPANADT